MTLAVYIAGHCIPTNAVTQLINHHKILGNTMHVTKANVVLSPRDPYSNATKMKNA